MSTRSKLVGALGVLLFSAGLLLGLALFGSAAWADLEASLFDTSLSGDARLKTLRCPVIITASEAGTAAATLSNPFERPTEFTIRAHVTQGFVTLMRELNFELPLDPGDKGTLEWEVTPDDAAYGRLIMVRVRVYPKYPIPSRHASCGIIVLDVPHLTGNQILAFVLAATLLSMAAGMGLWVAGDRVPSKLGLEVTRAMGALAACVLVGTIVALAGWWVFGVIVFAITVLLIGTIIGFFINRPDRS